MNVTKSQLSFLGRFVEVSDTRTTLNDKVNIEVVDDRAHFSLKTDSVVVTTSITLNEKGENFSIFLPVKTLASLIKTLPDEEEISINQNTISFKGGSYTLEALDEGVPLLKEIRQYDSEESDEIVIRNLKEFKLVEGFNGIDDSTKNNFFESVVSMDGHYVASDGRSIAIVKTENDSKRINFPRVVARLFSGLDQNSITVKIFTNKWMSFVIDSVQYFVPEKRSSIPDLEKFQSRLTIDGNVTIDRNGVKPILQRMSLVVSDKSKKAIYIKFENGNAIFGSVKYNLSNEQIEAKYDESVEGQRVVVSYDAFNAVYSSLKGDNLILGINTNESVKRNNITLTDEIETLNSYLIIYDDSET